MKIYCHFLFLNIKPISLSSLKSWDFSFSSSNWGNEFQVSPLKTGENNFKFLFSSRLDFLAYRQGQDLATNVSPIFRFFGLWLDKSNFSMETSHVDISARGSLCASVGIHALVNTEQNRLTRRKLLSLPSLNSRRRPNPKQFLQGNQCSGRSARKDDIAWHTRWSLPCEPEPFTTWCSYSQLLQLQRADELERRGRMHKLLQGSPLLLHRSWGLWGLGEIVQLWTMVVLSSLWQQSQCEVQLQRKGQLEGWGGVQEHIQGPALLLHQPRALQWWGGIHIVRRVVVLQGLRQQLTCCHNWETKLPGALPWTTHCRVTYLQMQRAS